MSHDTHGQSKENKTIISFKNSFWLVVILVGLFIAALNFIQAESGGEEHGAAKHETEATGHEAGGKAHENAEAHPAGNAEHETAAPAADTTHKAEH